MLPDVMEMVCGSFVQLLLAVYLFMDTGLRRPRETDNEKVFGPIYGIIYILVVFIDWNYVFIHG